MIGGALKKLAEENGMKVDQGIAYGSLRGFAATLSEGSGYKQIVFTTTFADPVKRTELMDLVSATDVKKQYRVLNLGISPRSIQVVFHDTIGTMKKICAFLDWFIPLLERHSATGVNTCTECGCEITAGRWVMVNGFAYYLHDSCAQKVMREIEEDNTRKKEETTGSYLTGTLGALLGSVLGAVVWALVLYMGYVASLVGLLIGWLAEKGYNLLKGKQGKAKVVILILAIIFGVLLGTFAADFITLVGMINDGELPGFGVGDIPMIIYTVFVEDAAYRGAMTSNILMGMLFAALGVFALLKKTGKEVSGTKVKALK